MVLILRKPQALKAFEHPKISIGGELSVAAGPVGNGAVFDSGLEAAPCWSYTKSKGEHPTTAVEELLLIPFLICRRLCGTPAGRHHRTQGKG